MPLAAGLLSQHAQEECKDSDYRNEASFQGNRKAACRLNTHIPHPRLKFHNLNSLSAHPQDKTGRERKNRILSHITEMLKGTDILCLQKTHLGANDTITLTIHFRAFQVFHKNHSLGMAGTIIMVRKDFATGFNIHQMDMGKVA